MLNDSEIAELWLIGKKNTSVAGTVQLSVIPWVIAQAMRAQCPVPGDTWDEFMTVVLRLGRAVPPHEHDRHLVVYYPEACDPIVVEGKKIDLQAGHIIHLPPGTTHEVPTVSRSRLCVAMLVPELP